MLDLCESLLILSRVDWRSSPSKIQECETVQRRHRNGRGNINLHTVYYFSDKHASNDVILDIGSATLFKNVRKYI